MSKTKNNSFFASSFFVLLILCSFLPGCSFQQVKKAIKPLSTETADFTQTKQNITVCVKKLDSKKLMELFGNKAKNLHIRKRKSKYHRSRKIVDVNTLQLSITNNSAQPIYLNKKDLSLQLVECKRIAYALRKNIFLGSTATKVAGFTGLGLITAGIIFALPATYAILTGPTCGCALIPILIGAAIATPGVFLTCTSAVGHFQRKHANKTNKQTFSDVTKKSICNKLVIQPGETKNVLLFVDEEQYKQQFAVTIINKTKSKHTFTVTL